MSVITVRENLINIRPDSFTIVAYRQGGSNGNCPMQAIQRGVGDKFRAMRGATDLMDLERLRLECRSNIQLLVSTGIYGRRFNFYAFRAVEKIYDQALARIVGWKFKAKPNRGKD